MEIRRLNSLRGLAALIVVVSHYSNATELFGRALGAGAGQLGVALFFLLSGFLMSHLYLGRAFSRAEAYGFLVSRGARVLPLFVFVIVFFYLLEAAGIFRVYRIGSVAEALCHLATACGESVLWTIPPEIHFYLLFVLLWGIMGARLGLLIFASAAFMLFWATAQWDKNALRWVVSPGIELKLTLPMVLPYFLAGALFGRLYDWKQQRSFRESPWFAASLLVVPFLFPQIAGSLGIPVLSPWRDVVALVMVAAAFYFVVFHVPDDSWLLSNAAGDFSGRVSYSLYLLHLPVLQLTLPYLRDAPLLLLFPFIALCLLVAQVSYLVIEKPSRRWIKDRLLGRDCYGSRKHVSTDTGIPN